MVEKLQKIGYRRLLFAIGVLLAVSEIWKELFMGSRGIWSLWYFPFQLCDAAMYLCLLLPLIPQGSRRERWVLTFLATYTLLGGMAAFLDTSGMIYPYGILTVHSFCWHLVLTAIGLCCGAVLRHQGGLSRGDFGGASLIFALCCVLAEVLNLLLDRRGQINMFYINPHYPMQQKYFADIAAAIGNVPGILFYLLCILGGAAGLFLLWRSEQKNRLKF